MDYKIDILVIGGGLAGLTVAKHLHKIGLEVMLVEKNGYPHHKVCGEYISNEVLPYMKWLGFDIERLCPTSIDKLSITTRAGTKIDAKLPLGGFGVSRHTLDFYLYQQLLHCGVTVIHDTVDEIEFSQDVFNVCTLNGIKFTAKQVLGAYGKRAALDKKLNRPFIHQNAPFLAVKAHYRGKFEKDLVALHHFKGGYCGVSKIEDDKINICYLADYEGFKKYKNIEAYQQEVLFQNRYLKEILQESIPLFDAPLTIGQLSFGIKEPVVNHMLMIGDTAGLIHPLCGNGMAIAIHSAKISAELLEQFFSGKIKNRTNLEKTYANIWNKNFSSRLNTGKILSALLNKEKMANLLLYGLSKAPALLNQIIKRTHGSPLKIQT